jgi:anti-anti-sigma factor
MQPIPAASQPDAGLVIESWHGEENEIVILLRGEVDFATAPDLQAAVSAAICAEPPPTTIILDLSGITLLDSIGIGAVVTAHRICEQAGVRLAAPNPSPVVARLFAVTGLRELLARW